MNMEGLSIPGIFNVFSVLKFAFYKSLTSLVGFFPWCFLGHSEFGCFPGFFLNIVYLLTI